MSEPLDGKRILITRTAAQAGALARPLEALGAEAVVCPTIEIVPPKDLSGLDRALAQLDRVDILVLSSPNAVKVFCDRLAENTLDPALLEQATVVAVGPKTAQAIAARGIRVDLVPEDYRAEGVVALLRDRVAGRCVLYPKAGLARDLIPKLLSEAGARVLDPVAYTSVAPRDAAERLELALGQGLDLLTFTASSTVRNLAQLLSPATLEQARRVPVASIGPLTSGTARELGFTVAVEPPASTLEALVEAIRDYFSPERSAS